MLERTLDIFEDTLGEGFRQIHSLDLAAGGARQGLDFDRVECRHRSTGDDDPAGLVWFSDCDVHLLDAPRCCDACPRYVAPPGNSKSPAARRVSASSVLAANKKHSAAEATQTVRTSIE